MTDTTDTARLAKELRELAHKIGPCPAAAHYVLLHDCAGRMSVLAAENAELRKVCDEADQLLRDLGLDPSRFRTVGGSLNAGKIRAALLHPESYTGLYIDGEACKRCGGLDWQVFTTSAGNMDRCKKCGHARWHEISAMAEGKGDE